MSKFTRVQYLVCNILCNYKFSKLSPKSHHKIYPWFCRLTFLMIQSRHMMKMKILVSEPNRNIALLLKVCHFCIYFTFHFSEDVKSLALPGTYHEKVVSLGSSLRKFSRLKHLDLSRNNIGSLQVWHLAYQYALSALNMCKHLFRTKHIFCCVVVAR